MNQYYNPNTYNPYDRNLQIIKDYFKRPAMLAFAVLSVLSNIVSFIVGIGFMFFGGSVLNQMIVGYYPELSAYFSESSGSMSVSVSLPILSLLAIVAAFCIYFKSKNPALSSTPKPFFTLNWVLAIISMISYILVTVLLLFAGIILQIIGSQYIIYYGLQYIGTIILALAAVVAFEMLTSVFKVMYWSSVRKSINGFTLVSKGSAAYGSFTVISAVITLLTGVAVNIFLFYFMSSTGFAPSYTVFLTVISAVSVVLSAAVLITDAVIAIGYNKYVKQINATGAFSEASPYAAVPNAPIGFTYNPYAEQNFVEQQAVEPKEEQIDEEAQPQEHTDSESSDDEQPSEIVSKLLSEIRSGLMPEQSAEQPSEELPEKLSDSSFDIKMDISVIDESENPFAEPTVQPFAQPYEQMPDIQQQQNGEAAQDFVHSFCPNCGAPVSPEHNFCSRCAMKLK